MKNTSVLDVDDILNQISKFIESNLRNVWVRNDEIDIYVRKSKRMFKGQFLDFFDLASINVIQKLEKMDYSQTLLIDLREDISK